MFEFFRDLANHAFLQYAVAAGILASVACGVVGVYVVTRRISYIAGGISHCVLALIIGLVSLYGKEREDTVISALWALGMATGIIFISQTPGYNADLVGYLFGNILMVSPGDLWLIAALDVVVVAFGVLFYNQFLAVCFDEEFARLRGLRVEAYYLLLLGLIALTVVLLVSVVGVVLVIALLTLPAAIAGHFTRTLWRMMILACGLSVLCTTGGIFLSYGPDLPSGATTIALTGILYLAVTARERFFKPRAKRHR